MVHGAPIKFVVCVFIAHVMAGVWDTFLSAVRRRADPDGPPIVQKNSKQDFMTKLGSVTVNMRMQEGRLEGEIARVDDEVSRHRQTLNKALKNPAFTRSKIERILRRELYECAQLENRSKAIGMRITKMMRLRNNLERIKDVKDTAEQYRNMIAVCREYSSATSEDAIREMIEGQHMLDERLSRDDVATNMFMDQLRQSIGSDLPSDLDEQAQRELAQLEVGADTWAVSPEETVQTEMAQYLSQWDEMRALDVGDTLAEVENSLLQISPTHINQDKV